MEQLPLGVAIWGKLSAAAAAKLEKGERFAPPEWRSGGPRVADRADLAIQHAGEQARRSDAPRPDARPIPPDPIQPASHRPRHRPPDKVLVSSHINAAAARGA